MLEILLKDHSGCYGLFICLSYIFLSDILEEVIAKS